MSKRRYKPPVKNFKANTLYDTFGVTEKRFQEIVKSASLILRKHLEDKFTPRDVLEDVLRNVVVYSTAEYSILLLFTSDLIRRVLDDQSAVSLLSDMEANLKLLRPSPDETVH